ncbi:ABC transporter permease [Sporosarcina sp. BP05]|uniref:ABC transporter permease n=1 Tax=Sporosarcina sp. BP05 TaxID=2758726 RepID=UPI001C95ABF8|nr:ABC transporter permease [Sporosarcina sp. BP05]
MIGAKSELRIPAKRVSLALRVSRITGLKWLLLFIPLGYIMVLMFFSMFDFFKLSVFNDDGFTLQYLSHIFTTPVYLKVLWLTVKIALIVTFCALIFAYPVAYMLVRTESGLWKKVIFAAVLIPFWISLLVRTYAWTILLQKNGAINKLLLELGIINEPLDLLYNTTGVVIGMTHILLPYMILSLYSVMEGIDQRLLQAAQGMGARPWKAFIQIFLPLSLPGVLAGSLLVFVMGLGYYITPALLGGAGTPMISMLIESNINTTLNWHLASALSLVLFVATLLLLLIALLITRSNPMLKGLE